MSGKFSSVALIVTVGITVGSCCAGRNRLDPLRSGDVVGPAPSEPGEPTKESTALVEYSLPNRASIGVVPAEAYRIGIDDELEVSVYGDADLVKTQTVRPDGKIGFPLIGEVRANGLTPAELREQMTQALAEFVKDPQVAVIVTQYNSRRVVILGQVETPGLIRLTSDIDLLEGISRAGGVTDAADLRGALLVRAGEILPVSLEKLLRQGDLEQNVLLRANDVVLIPNINAKKAFVLGEVKEPLVLPLKYDVNLAAAISLAGGFTRSAEKRNVLIVRGGLGDPKIIAIDFNKIIKQGNLAQNLRLEPNDIVYVPKSRIADVVGFFQNLRDILGPTVMAETGIILAPDVWDVLTEFKTDRPISITP